MHGVQKPNKFFNLHNFTVQVYSALGNNRQENPTLPFCHFASTVPVLCPFGHQEQALLL